MKIGVVTLFPELIEPSLQVGVIGAALKTGSFELTVVNPRQFTHDVHKTVDDRPFGGRDGMLMLGEPLAKSVELAKAAMPDARVVHLSPRGRLFTDRIAREWADECRDIILVSSRYAGVDERFIEECCDEELSIGDFVVSGGELPALLVIDAVLRHCPGVLGNSASAEKDSFADGRLESAQYTRPREWRGRAVPAVLVGGDPKKIAAFEWLSSMVATIERRPDLAARLGRSKMRLEWKLHSKWLDRDDITVAKRLQTFEAWLQGGLEEGGR